MAADNDRIYSILGDMQETLNYNHNEVCQRITALETNQHTPISCPAATRIGVALDKHKADVALEKRDEGWKMFAKEVARAIVAALVALGTTMRLR